MTQRCGLVAVLGAPNAGKSTLVNALVGQKVAIVSPKAQTTRARLMGIAIEGETQMLLIDTPGIFTPNRRLDRARDFVRRHWAPYLDGQQRAPTHPKSGLQEVAAARNLGVPAYELVSRFGPHHAPRFKVKVSLGRHGEAEAEGASKQEAETAAAAALLETLK